MNTSNDLLRILNLHLKIKKQVIAAVSFLVYISCQNDYRLTI